MCGSLGVELVCQRSYTCVYLFERAGECEWGKEEGEGENFFLVLLSKYIYVLNDEKICKT